MSAPTSNRLIDIMNGLQARLEGDLRGNRAAVTQPGVRGEASEDDWLRVFKDHLPHRYQADRAFVIDSHGDCNDQIDIVIYDRQYSSFLYNQANQRYIPAENVYGVLEVRQDLSRDHVLCTGQRAVSVRQLHRTSAHIPYAEGSYKPPPVPRIIAGIVTYQSTWISPFGDRLPEVLSDLRTEAQLDIGCALVNGAFEVKYRSGQTVDLMLVETHRSLVQFFMRLLKQLQALATAPAINYHAYLERFQQEGNVH